MTQTTENGERVPLPDGRARYVATVVLSPNVNDQGALAVRRAPGLRDPRLFASGSRKPQLERRATLGTSGARLDTLSRGAMVPQRGIYIPARGRGTPDYVDLYASVEPSNLDSLLVGGSRVSFASGDQANWREPGEGEPLTPFEVLVARDLPVGQPFVCQVALTVPPTAFGRQTANVHFSVRPSVGTLGASNLVRPGAGLPTIR